MSTSEPKIAPTTAALPGSVTDSSEKVERIREILFGAQMREFTQKFDLVQREVVRLQQEIIRLNEQLREQDKTLRKQLREEGERLATQLQEQDARQGQQLTAAEQRQLEQLQNVDQRHTQHAQQLGEQIRRTERAVLGELSQVSTELNHAKADRSVLGNLLIDLGASLKAKTPDPITKVTDVLDQLSEELQ
ncbi:MAG: hypothetical protein U0350_16710 [Caldilineaceae bacterium]